MPKVSTKVVAPSEEQAVTVATKEPTKIKAKTKPAKNKVKAKKAGMSNAQPKPPKTEAPKTPPQYETLMAECLKWMSRGRQVSTRDVVLGLGRTPGSKEGTPVFDALQRLTAAGKVKGEKKPNGWLWIKTVKWSRSP